MTAVTHLHSLQEKLSAAGLAAASPMRAALAAAALAGLVSAQGVGTPNPGFTLFAPFSDSNTYLLDLSGTIVHSWPSGFRPGAAVYLADDGNLMRTIRTDGPVGFGIGGNGGGIQEIAWDGTLLWDYRHDDMTHMSHHDIEILPNGNILLIAWENLSPAVAIGLGRDPAQMTAQVWLPDHIAEIQKTGPTAGTIVWEWKPEEHVIQDFDPTKATFGVVADNPQLIDINYPPTNPQSGEWMHANGVKYNANFDQIVLSVRKFSEIWVIDHSTTPTEVAGHTGGLRGMGGDLLYRWGNPEAYQSGTASDQQLYEQHDANWIPDGYPGAGNIIIFNNGNFRPAGMFSSIEEITTPVDAAGNYPIPAPGTTHLPLAPTWTYTTPTPTDFFSPAISGVVRQPNGNTLICSGIPGQFFEVDPAGNKVWEYFNTLPNPALPSVFKIRRYERYLWPSTNSLSVTTGGVVDFNLEAGVANASSAYLLLASFSGTSPGTPLPGGLATIALNYDALSALVLSNPVGPTFSSFFGTLDGTGEGLAQLNLGSPLSASLIGLTADFAYTTFPAFDFVSNPVPLTFIP